MFKQENLLIP